MRLNIDRVHQFQEVVWGNYRQHARQLPWREPEVDGNFDPYKILISEVMLQQTQAARVIPKYQAFLEEFPHAASLAAVPLGDVLRAWSGLGYNRRAKFLWQTARLIEKGFPTTPGDLEALPGIGRNTAAAILVYAFNQPLIFIETNIRTVYIHHFYKDNLYVADKELLPIIEQTIDREQPRDFYWALMDYGTYLKKTVGNVSQRSKHYVRQSQFEGSKRQLRGKVVKLLSMRPHSRDELNNLISDERLDEVIAVLCAEKLIHETNNMLMLE